MPGIPWALSDLQPDVEQQASWRLVAVTYNATSLKSVAVQTCLETCFAKSGATVVGLQETRCFPGKKVVGQHFVKFCSADVEGNLGCQLWISKRAVVATLPPSDASGHPLCVSFDFQKAVICTATPRILSVCIPAGKKLFAFVVAHALTSAATEEDIRIWWAQLDSAVRRLPRRALPVFMLDASAKVLASHVEHRLIQTEPVGENANQLHSLARSLDLDAGPLFDEFEQRHVTWTSPHGSSSQIDYILFPECMRAAVLTAGVPAGFVDPHGYDHTPLQLTFQWREEARPTTKVPSLDVERMRTPAGREQLAAIYAAIPPVPWEVHPDTHLQIINDHLFSHLQSSFAKQAARPRSDGVSDVQWAAIRERRQARRQSK